ncbi:MAG: c-type cytochrome [bacterium]
MDCIGKKKLLIAIPIVVATFFFAGCFQGRPSEKPPIHINPNMDKMERYRPQGSSAFFVDKSAMRLPVPGTVARGDFHEDDAYFSGVDASGDTVRNIPVPITLQLLTRGRERYEIFCSPCHGAVGDGKGIVVARGLLPPPTFHSDLMRNYPDGHIFGVITNGIRNMPAYGHQVSVDDRWAIIAYMRALQRSQNARREDLPREIREQF